MAVKSIRVCDCCYPTGKVEPAVGRFDLCLEHSPKIARKKVAALVKTKKSTKAGSKSPKLVKCKICKLRFKSQGLGIHMMRAHGKKR